MANVTSVGDNLFWRLDVDFSDADRQIDNIVSRAEHTEETLKELQDRATKTIRRVMGAVRGSWGIIQGLVRAGGGAISMTTRLVASTVIGGIQTMIPLLAAAKAGGLATLNMGQVLAAGMGMLEIGTSLIALQQYQQGEAENVRALRGYSFMMGNMSSMINAYL